MTAVTPVQFHPDALAAPVDVSWWQILFVDPGSIVFTLLVTLVLVGIAITIRVRYGRFYKLQRAAFDHRRTTDAEVMARQESFQQLISQQYGVTNGHNQQVLAKAEEALRLNAQTLAQIVEMNRTLTRIVERLEPPGGAAA